MQTCMAVMNKKKCFYVVYCKAESFFCVFNVSFNHKLWNEQIYPPLKLFIENHIVPNIPKICEKRNILPPNLDITYRMNMINIDTKTDDDNTLYELKEDISSSS